MQSRTAVKMERLGNTIPVNRSTSGLDTFILSLLQTSFQSCLMAELVSPKNGEWPREKKKCAEIPTKVPTGYSMLIGLGHGCFRTK